MTAFSGLLHQAMKHSASIFPDKVAFKTPVQSLSYSELEKKSNQVSNLLYKNGRKKGDRVGILMHRCIETSYAIYGILQAGCVYVPLDPKAPIKRLNYQIENCDIDLVLTVKQQKRVHNQINCKCIEISEEVLAQFDADFEEVSLSNEDNAYILYTSGSTGVPKGILHTHKSGYNFARLCQLTFDIKADDLIANHAPIFFDISTLAYFTGPLCGAGTLIIPDAYTIMAASMVDLISKEEVSMWYSVPLALIQMLETGQLKDDAVSSLKTIFYAGEAFNPRQLRRLMEALPERRIINLYGPTETNVCTFHEVTKLPGIDDRIPIGKTWDKTHYRILEEELLIASVTNMKAYWGNENLTELSFLENEGERYYRTGDLVEEIDNLLYLKGRKDHQIKFRGFRIELGDIESAFQKHSDVKEVVAFLSQDKSKEQEIICFIRAEENSNTKEISDFVKDLLPKYAVPSKIIMLDEFPRTSTGKVQRSEILKLLS